VGLKCGFKMRIKKGGLKKGGLKKGGFKRERSSLYQYI